MPALTELEAELLAALKNSAEALAEAVNGRPRKAFCERVDYLSRTAIAKAEARLAEEPEA